MTLNKVKKICCVIVIHGAENLFKGKVFLIGNIFNGKVCVYF